LQEGQLADVKWQQAVFEVLLSYHPFWLRLGLETVVGQLLPADTGETCCVHLHNLPGKIWAGILIVCPVIGNTEFYCTVVCCQPPTVQLTLLLLSSLACSMLS